MALPFIEEMPKIELHCHLDGSLDLENAKELLLERGEEYSLSQLKDLMQVDLSCPNLAEYLKRFVLPNHCLQDAAGLKASAYHLAKNAANENVKYIEVRFAPTSSQDKGMKLLPIIEAVEEGLKQAREEFDIETGIILCMMRGLDDDRNLSVVKAGMELLGNGVVACDIAGDEASYPMSNHRELFRQIKKIGMPYTIHVGETGNAANIREALELGAKRLGHGIAMAKDEALMQECGRLGVGVEICPTSNLQTKAYNNISDCPIFLFKDHGIPVSLNTDNRTVSDTTLTNEFKIIDDCFGLEEELVRQIYKDSVEMSFASDEIKHTLLSKY